jgi:hypothetical protein
MKPHINIGTIGHIDHGKTTLTAAICAAMAHKSCPDAIILAPPADGNQLLTMAVAAEQYQPAPIVMDYRPRRSPLAAALVLPIMCGMMSMMPGWSAGNPSQQERNDPNREKTPQDLERMAAAQRKRDRKAARKGPQNAEHTDR